MNTSKHSFFIESTDPRQEARALALEVICCLLLWMADEPSIEDRRLRTVPRHRVRPDLMDGRTLGKMGDGSGRTRQHFHKFADSFRGQPTSNHKVVHRCENSRQDPMFRNEMDRLCGDSKKKQQPALLGPMNHI